MGAPNPHGQARAIAEIKAKLGNLVRRYYAGNLDHSTFLAITGAIREALVDLESPLSDGADDGLVNEPINLFDGYGRPAPMPRARPALTLVRNDEHTPQGT